MSKTECLIFSDGIVDVFILKPMINMSDSDCIDTAIRILNDGKNDIEEQLALEREKASKEIDDEIKRLENKK